MSREQVKAELAVILDKLNCEKLCMMLALGKGFLKAEEREAAGL